MGRSPCCAKQGLNRGAWTPLEDKILTDYIESHGEGKWRSLPQRAGLKRCGKSCRLRWLNYLRPDIKRGNISDDEVDLIIRLHNLLGNRWSLIAGRLPGRTDNEIKNYWNTTIGKKMQGAQASSSKKCKQSSTLSKAVTNLRMNNNEQPIAPIIPKNIGSCVVRTKAIRCTKVFIDADIQSTQQPGIIAVTAPSTAHDVRHDFKDDINPTENVHCKAPHSGGVPVSPTLSGQEGYFPGFAMDFEMDDKLFCDFLNVDMVYDDDFGKGAAESTNDDTHDHEVNVFSPNPCQNGRLHDSDDLGSMTSFLDPAMDWLIS